MADECDLYNAAQRVAGELPDGFEVTLNLEAGYGGVELIHDGVQLDISDKFAGDETLAEEVLIALQTAKDLDT